MIWLLRTRQLRKQAKLEGKHFDDLPEARKYQYHSKKRDQQRSSPLDLAAQPAQKESGIVSYPSITTASDMDSIELAATNTLRDQDIASLSENEKIE